MINKIYLHWTAGRYDQLFNDYHICIDGEGKIHQMADFGTKLAHTWLRNTDAIGIALCCCYGATIKAEGGRMRYEGNKEEIDINWGSYPPTEIQIVSMAQCVAEICREYNLPIRRETVMTHAEVAELDGYGVFDNDPDMRWDLLRLPGFIQEGGDVIRDFAEDILDGGDIFGYSIGKGGELVENGAE